MRIMGYVAFVAVVAIIATQQIAKYVQPSSQRQSSAATQNAPVQPITQEALSRDNSSAREPANSYNASAHPNNGKILPALGGGPGCYPGQAIQINADRSGHYFAEVEINGRGIPMVVDTGATIVAIPFEDANRIGLNLSGGRKSIVQTANGPSQSTILRVPSLRLGPICLFDIEVSVAAPNALSSGLLGMNVIGQLKRFEVSNSRLVMAQ